MIRKILLSTATAIILGAGFVGAGSIVAPTTAQAQWRDYDRPYYGNRRQYRERGYRRPSYGQRQEYRGGGGGGAARGQGYGYRPGQVLPGGRTYETAPGRQGPGGMN